jgi:glucan biosynthesis protein C
VEVSQLFEKPCLKKIKKVHNHSRLAWVDNLRTFIIFLVVSMHACVTYSYVGGWYINYPPGPSAFEQIIFIIWQAHLQSFFMGLLFFIAGVFAHQTMKKRGVAGLMKKRWIRLGIPSLFYILFIQPLIVYAGLREPEDTDFASFMSYWFEYLSSGSVLGGSGPMWFAVALWIFCCVYAIKEMLVGEVRLVTPRSQMPRPSRMWLLGLGLVCGSFLVRLAYPLGSNFFNMQLGFFTQYVAAFSLGIIADRKGWFGALVLSNQARSAGWLGLIIGPLFLMGLVAAGGPPPQDGTIVYSGGWNPWAFGLCFWEQLTGLSLALGLMFWFRKLGNSTHLYAVWLSRRSFGVYMLHSPIMVTFTPVCNSIADTSRLMAAAVLTMLSLVASYIATDLILRIPWIKKFI